MGWEGVVHWANPLHLFKEIILALDDALAICSRAMVLISADNVTSFTDGTNESQVAAALYEPTLKSCLTEHRWNFAVLPGQASKLVDKPKQGFAFQYELPAPILSIDKVTPDHIPYELYANRKIFTDYDGEVWIDGIYRVDETAMPAYFIEYLEYRLAAKFAFPITADKTLAQAMSDSSKVHQKMAKSADSKQRKGVGIKKFPLILVRG